MCQSLEQLREQWKVAHLEWVKASNNVYAHLGVINNPKVKKKKIHRVESKKLEKLDARKQEYEVAKNRYFAALSGT